MSRKHLHLATLLVATLAACSSNSPSDGAAGSAGASMQGSAGASAGAPSAGAGAPSAGAPSAGAPSAGSSGAIGIAGAPAGGSASGGGGGSAAGAPAGGAGGGSAAGAGGMGGGSTGVVAKSAGCGKSGRPANGKVTVASQEIIDFPASYDGTKPFPLLIALHACGNPNTQWEGLTKGSGFETEYVRLMPNTTESTQCWDQSSDAANSARILMQYDDVLANYCVDTNQVFGVGHSSGAQMLVRVLANKTQAQHLNFKGVAPFAGDPANVSLVIPVLYTDGIGDTQRSPDSAKNTVAKFRAANMCSDTSKPYTPVMGCTDGGTTVDPGCIIYDNCKAPTIWCAHNDPNYLSGGQPTYHGVPCFGVKAAYDFFKTL